MTTDDEVKRLLDLHADALTSLPNVVGVGVVDDDAPGEAAVAVYVSTKVPEEQLAAKDVVPKELTADDGRVLARTRVIEVGEITH